jgi:hypothetical protein
MEQIMHETTHRTRPKQHVSPTPSISLIVMGLGTEQLGCRRRFISKALPIKRRRLTKLLDSTTDKPQPIELNQTEIARISNAFNLLCNVAFCY